MRDAMNTPQILRIRPRYRGHFCSRGYLGLTKRRPTSFLTARRRSGRGRTAFKRSTAEPASPQILAVDHRHRHGIEIEIIHQPRIDADPRIVEIRLARRPVRRLRICPAPAIGAEMMSDGAAAPLI